MRQQTIVKTYLKFNELTEKQQKKVIANLSDINVDNSYWYEHIVDDFEAKLKKLGFYDIKTEFSGFYSQGDGACFTAKHKKGEIYKGRYSLHSHSNTMACDESQALLQLARRLADNFYRELYKEYTYLTSEQAVIEMIEANDYEFDSDTLQIVGQ